MANYWQRVWGALSGKKETSSSDLLPPPIAQRGPYNRITGYGSGRLWSLLREWLPGTKVNYAQEAGDLLLNSAVAIPIFFITRNWGQCQPRVMRKAADGNWVEVEGHPATALLRNPQPGVPASLWWEWVLTDYLTLGNSFPRKMRGMGGMGEPTALQYLPGDMVAPMGDNVTALTHYVYRADGQPYPLQLDDVIHIRQGRDPRDWRLGRARINSVLREIVADNASSSTHVAYTRSNGTKATVFSLKDRDDEGGAEPLTEGEARDAKESLQEATGGDNAGKFAVMSFPFDSHEIGFSPREMDMGVLRKTPEERISAIFGIPAVVLGFGAGLERSTYNNMSEARQQAWEEGILPLMAVIADFMTEALLPDFAETQPGDKVEFDSSGVRALADDLVSMANRAALLFEKGVIDRATAKRMAGEKATPEDVGVYAQDAVSDPLEEDDAEGPPAKVARFRTSRGERSRVRQFANYP